MENIDFQKKGYIGIITIQREKALNALNSGVLDELNQTFDCMDLKEIRCIILIGAGSKAFVAGADITEMKDFNKEQANEFSASGNKLFRKIETFPVPVIAAVNGYALGGGCELALCCDIRLAAENAVFSQPETSLGIIPGFGGTQRLARTIGQGRAKEMIYAGTRLTAAQALEVGLVNRVVPLEELLPESMKLAEKIANNAPIAVRASKKAITKGIDLDLDTALSLEAALFKECFETEDQKNAMGAFVNKETPKPFTNK